MTCDSLRWVLTRATVLSAAAITGCGGGGDGASSDAGDATHESGGADGTAFVEGGRDARTDASIAADAGSDASSDATEAEVDVRSPGTGDGGSEGSSEAGSDSGPDATTEAGVEGGQDAGPEAGSMEGGPEAGFDASDAATCDAGLLLCGGACTSTQSDAHNCGTCGHDCLGGACSGGQCKPVVLAPATPGGSLGLAADATTLYWLFFESRGGRSGGLTSGQGRRDAEGEEAANAIVGADGIGGHESQLGPAPWRRGRSAVFPRA